MNISTVGPLIQSEGKVDWPLPTGKTEGAPEGERSEKTSTFADLLRQVITTESQAQQAVESYAVGKSQNIHETMLSLEKADISFSLLVNVRNKLLDAYKEVMRMS